MDASEHRRRRFTHAESAQTVRISDRHYQALAKLAISEKRSIRSQLERLLDGVLSVTPRYEERSR